MILESEKLIQELIDRTLKNLQQAEKFRNLPIEKLNWRFEKESWSILECFEHLNLYGDFYIAELQTRIENSKNLFNKSFKSGILGSYFAKSMLPKEKLNKMKTFKDKNPLGSELDKTTIERFILDQEQLLILLNKSRGINLNKTKTAISISKLIKLKIGDTFRVVIYHNERHIVQANKILDRKTNTRQFI